MLDSDLDTARGGRFSRKKKLRGPLMVKSTDYGEGQLLDTHH